MMAFYIWGNPATLLGIVGIFTVLGGSLLYTLVKMSESKSKASAAPAPPPPPQPAEKDVEMPGESTSISATKQRRTGL